MTACCTPPTLGQGRWSYRMLERWGQLPEGWTMGDVGGVAVDGRDHVYVFHRGPRPLLVFDEDGNFLRNWGDDLFVRPHGISIGIDGLVYCTDEGDHTVRSFTPEGKPVLTIGVPGHAAPRFSGNPFHRCTHTALSPEGDIYVADGYGNARVHKYAPDGRHILSWGQAGSGHGEFNLVHNISCDPDGWVYVADRENHRIQVFDANGRYEAQWHNLHRPCGLFTQPRRQPVSYIGEIGPGLAANHDYPGLGPRISIVDHRGQLLSRLDGGLGSEPGKFIAPHGLAVDSQGSIYVGEIASAGWKQRFPGTQPPPGLPTLRKLVRLDLKTPPSSESLS